MRGLILGLTVSAFLFPLAATAQDTGAIEIPSLAAVVSNMDASELSEMESSIAEMGSIAVDVDVAVEASVDAAVSEAIEEGLISAEEAADATASLSLVADNAQFFNFDILDAIASIVESGEFTMAEVRSTLEGFNSLSEAGKTVVGQESFDYIAAHDSGHGDYTTAKAQWDSSSAADQSVIEYQMTAITEFRPAGSC